VRVEQGCAGGFPQLGRCPYLFLWAGVTRRFMRQRRAPLPLLLKLEEGDGDMAVDRQDDAVRLAGRGRGGPVAEVLDLGDVIQHRLLHATGSPAHCVHRPRADHLDGISDDISVLARLGTVHGLHHQRLDVAC